PAPGRSRVVRSLMQVVFPAPLAPGGANTSLLSTGRSRPSVAVVAANAVLAHVNAGASCWASAADGARAGRGNWLRSVAHDAVLVMSRSAMAASLLEKSLSGGICVCRKLYMIVTRNIRRTQYRMAK